MSLRSATSDFSVALFPLLKTSGPVTIGRLEFRSTEDTSGLPRDRAAAVTEIAEMLYLQDDLRLKSASYAIVPFADFSHAVLPDLTDLEHIQAVVAYRYAAPHPTMGRPFFSSEHASLAIFSPCPVSIHLVRPDFHVVAPQRETPPAPDARGEIRGYWGLYNFRHHFWVAPGSRVYGPKPHMSLNQAQDLKWDFSVGSGERRDLELLERLLAKPPSSNGARVFTALRWFGAANQEASDEAGSIVNLAIAFEALLRLPETEKTDRIVDTIALLLGRVPRLDVWARQFYDARAQIVHEGTLEEPRFVARDSQKGGTGGASLSLLAYGRQIFQLCLTTLLSGLELAQTAELEEKFVTNQERFQQICRIATDTTLSPGKRLEEIEPLVEAIERFKFNPETGLRLESMVEAARAVARLALDAGDSLSTDMQTVLEATVATRRTPDNFEALESILYLANMLSESAPGRTRGTDIVGTLARSIWHYTATHYYWLRETRPGPAGRE